MVASPPYPDKAWLRSMPLPAYSLPVATVSPFSTLKSSITTAAAMTMQEIKNPGHGLKRLAVGEYIWDRLFAYVSLVPFSNRDIPGTIYRMWECPNAPKDAPPQFREAQERLKISLVANAHHQPILVHNNDELREACNQHIFDILNKYLELRYTNTRWISPVKFNQTDESQSASGNSDKLLVMYPKMIPAGMTLADARAVAEPIRCSTAEVKPGWSYETKSLEDIYRGDKGVLNYQGRFLTDASKHPGNQLIRQMWGQCFFLSTKIAFTTNLDGVMVLLQDLEGCKMILSSLLPWTDDRVLSCLVALSFMAVDAPEWATMNAPDGGENGLTLIDMLAPPAECSIIQAEQVPPSQ
ncbi:hypothetical protein NLJ89_g5051 [Agrocybe chaxingu]|uniref:Uncharacterized protein n=1 Tax=Agrocybe chaxingu TaxID=84603 RepID=A0A9W8K1W5_9AGAR|nr:hypothetical protein NLJ89_g5051 [Agrocybe chaxingu]